MNQEAYKDFIRKRNSLFWYIREDQKEKMPFAQVVETILNFGDEKDVRELFELAGIEKVAKCFYRQTQKKGGRTNYLPQVENFFRLFFDRHLKCTKKSYRKSK